MKQPIRGLGKTWLSKKLGAVLSVLVSIAMLFGAMPAYAVDDAGAQAPVQQVLAATGSNIAGVVVVVIILLALAALFLRLSKRQWPRQRKQ